MSRLYAYFLQYGIRPRQGPAEGGGVACGIATVIVFAEYEELAKARAGRHIARQGWEIIEVMRGMLVRQYHLEKMDGVLKKLYHQAEQAGIAATFDSWQNNRPASRAG
jgi:hypothetical protein